MPSSLRIEKCLALPLEYTANTLYLVKEANSNIVKVFISDNTGATLGHVPTTEDILGSTILYSDTTPELPNSSMFWWDTTTGALYVQFISGETTVWVEAMPSIDVPEFGGDGTADTMSRSDHTHSLITLTVSEW
jgi:hypothetical protein